MTPATWQRLTRGLAITLLAIALAAWWWPPLALLAPVAAVAWLWRCRPAPAPPPPPPPAAGDADMPIRRMARGLAHNVNNLLTVVQGNLGILEAVLPADACRTERRDMELAVGRLTALVHRLQRVARRATPELVPGDLKQVLEQVADKLDIAAADRDLATVGEVRFDWAELPHAITGLVTVCREFPATAPVRLCLAEASYRDGPAAAITVIGPGITLSDKVLAEIFLPYVTLRENGKGPELLLTEAAAVAAEHGGCLTAANTPAGIAFVLTLPREATAE